MREVGRVAVDNVGLALLQMMEHAGRNLADVGILRGVYDALGVEYTDPFDGARRVWLRNRT